MSQILKAYCIHDVKAEAYNQPFFAPAKGAAIRDFSALVNDGESMVAKYPHDYTLFEVGSFDMERGTLEAIVPLSLGNGLEYVKAKDLSLLGSGV